jgi:SAM-dependent methyltransferase
VTRQVLSPIGSEALDSPALDPSVTRATLSDIARSNLLFGGRGAVAYGVGRLTDGSRPDRALTLLDVGAGLGDVARYLERDWRGGRNGLKAVALDWHPEAARLCGERDLLAVQGDAMRLPVADGSVDVAVASQLLHHFNRQAAIEVVRELDRVARVGVVIADIRRSRLASWGIWFAAHALRFHRVSRHDGVVSVRRGYKPRELGELLGEAGVDARVDSRPGFRLVATWRVNGAHA